MPHLKGYLFFRTQVYQRGPGKILNLLHQRCSFTSKVHKVGTFSAKNTHTMKCFKFILPLKRAHGYYMDRKNIPVEIIFVIY